MRGTADGNVNVLRPPGYIRHLARQQIIQTIQSDIDGGEGLMKEVWEECKDEVEVAEVKDQMAAIILAIEGLK